MCGIALLVGPGARTEYASFAAMLATVAPRGEVEETLADEDALLGTHRLRMKVTYCPDAECEEPIVEGFVTPGSFRFVRPRTR